MTFKIFVIVAIISTTVHAGPLTYGDGEVFKIQEPRDALSDLLKGIIESIRQGLIDANADPFPIPNINLTLTDQLLKGKIALSEVNVAGVTGFNVTKIVANLIQLKVDLGFEFPLLEIAGNYDIDATALAIIPVYGKGPFSIKVSTILMEGGGKLKLLTGGYLSITNVSYALSLGELDVKFEGLLGGGDLGDALNQIISNLGLNIFNFIEGLAHNIIVDTFTAVANLVLKDWTLADIIGGGKSTTTTTTTTVAPSEVTTEQPVVTTEPPVVSTEQPTVTTGQPVVSTEQPTVTTERPIVSTEQPTVTTERPVVTTERPIVTTERPIVTTEQPIDTTERPIVTTERPIVTTNRT